MHRHPGPAKRPEETPPGTTMACEMRYSAESVPSKKHKVRRRSESVARVESGCTTILGVVIVMM